MTETLTHDLPVVLDTIAVLNRDDLNAVARALAARRVTLDAESTQDLKVGDRIVIGQEVSPRYFAGCVATVIQPPTATRVKVQLDNPPFKAIPRYCREDGVINVLLSTVTAI